MRILVSGISGLVGSELKPFLTTGGHEVVGLSRSPAAENRIHWDIDAHELNPADLENFDVVVHLHADVETTVKVIVNPE